MEYFNKLEEIRHGDIINFKVKGENIIYNIIKTSIKEDGEMTFYFLNNDENHTMIFKRLKIINIEEYLHKHKCKYRYYGEIWLTPNLAKNIINMINSLYEINKNI